MRTIVLLVALLLPAAATAGAPAPKKPVKTKATPTPAPPRAALDEAAAAERDELLADAKHKLALAEFLEARALYRKAVRLDPSSAEARKGLAEADQECLESARRQISEAKMYRAASNDAEAVKALERALKYADQSSHKENQQARDLMAAIKRETER